MSTANTGKSNAMIAALIVVVACLGFMITSFISTNQDLEKVHAEMKSLRTNLDEQVVSLKDQINNRYLTLLKMSEDLSSQQSKMLGVERTIMAEREALAKLQENFRNEIAQVKKLGGDASRMVTSLEEQFKQEVKVKEVKLARLQDDFESVKNQIEDQSALLVMMREQALMNQQFSKPPEGTTTVTLPVTTPSGTLSVPATDSPSTTTSPQNNRVVTDLPSSSPTPVTPAGN
jgi:uncharacterized membrane-anchored protein YhcB (DUF1043 family)